MTKEKLWICYEPCKELETCNHARPHKNGLWCNEPCSVGHHTCIPYIDPPKEKECPADKEMSDRILTFFKEAFCIDGEIRWVKNEGFTIPTHVIELNDSDSKRGRFYMATLDKKACPAEPCEIDCQYHKGHGICEKGFHCHIEGSQICSIRKSKKACEEKKEVCRTCNGEGIIGNPPFIEEVTLMGREGLKYSICPDCQPKGEKKEIDINQQIRNNIDAIGGRYNDTGIEYTKDDAIKNCIDLVISREKSAVRKFANKLVEELYNLEADDSRNRTMVKRTDVLSKIKSMVEEVK